MTKKKKSSENDSVKSIDTFGMLCKRLTAKLLSSQITHLYASVHTILFLLGSGITLRTTFVSGFGQAPEERIWQRFSTGYLKQTLSRMEKERLIKRNRVSGGDVFSLTQRGVSKVMPSLLSEMQNMKKKEWDGKWRIVMYDIDSRKKTEQQGMRKLLKQLGFIAIQKSVYLTPYPTRDEVDYLRSTLGTFVNMKYLVVEKLEDDILYREHFKLH